MTEGGGRRGEGEATTSEVGASDVRKLVFGAIGGALAGLGPRLVTYPFEVLKSRSQVRTAIHKSAALPSVPLSSIVRETWKRHGLRKGFFPGVHVALLGTIPGSATYFFGYELGKSVFQSEYVQRQMGATGTSLGRSAWFEGALCGVTAQCIANIVFTPVDITKERMQVQANLVATGKQPRLYTATEMIVRIARNEGGSIDDRFPVARPAGLTRHILSPCKSFAPFSQWLAPGLHVFMRGYWRGNMLWMPWSTIYISTYEALKDLPPPSSPPSPSQSPPSALHLGLCAGLASAFASVCTHPIDVVKTRVQALPSDLIGLRSQGGSRDRTQGGTGERGGSMSSALHLWRREGLRGLFAGLHLRVLQLSPATVMTWVIYERVKEEFLD